MWFCLNLQFYIMRTILQIQKMLLKVLIVWNTSIIKLRISNTYLEHLDNKGFALAVYDQ